jgi:deazaflavin-dependent oxidoreductase (nitroreductase family)
MIVMQRFNRLFGERMAASGRMAMIEVIGRTSGQKRRTPVGYVRNEDGSVWLGAGRADSQWPKNLLSTPRCRVKIGRDELAYEARELTGDAREKAVAAIHAKYGERAGRVGTGPVFELRVPADEAAA